MNWRTTFRYAAPVAVALAIGACNTEKGGFDPANAVFGKGGCPGKGPCVENDAANPRYQYSNYSATATSLSNSIKQVGLGAFSTVVYELSADHRATYNCRNRAGNVFPTSVPWYREYNFPTTPFSVDPSNGQVTATFTLQVPDPNTDPNAPNCGDGPSARQWSWVLDTNQPAGWTNIKFCWGQESTTQGPVPGGNPGASGNYLLAAGSAVAGGPLEGDAAAVPPSGIFATQCLPAANP